jgi:proteasome lid subunit RPN8/RPN11
MRIARSMLDQIVAQARDEAPNECCGIIGVRDGAAVAVHPVRNAAASPLRYEMDPKDQLRVFEALDDAELDVGAIYHSHTRSEPLPSQTDINLAFYPDALYVILGVKDADRDDVRAWRIVDGKVSEATLEVEEG